MDPRIHTRFPCWIPVSIAAAALAGTMDPMLRRLQESNTPDLVLSCPPSEGPLLGNVRPRQFPPGRAMLLTRREHFVFQTASVDSNAG
jgi:S-DNA-T family DNA segregation ATPase FtsK/SpoIIIE